MAAFTAPRAALQDATEVTFLFTDIEGSTRLWEQQPERMRHALARHDELARCTVQRHGGVVVKTTGDGIHAAFDDALDAVRATLELQEALADPAATGGLPLAVRCGLHAGPNERRDGDFYGSVVNRAARIMGAAHGGQMLVSHAVAERIAGRLPEAVVLRDLGPVRLRDLSSAERLYQLVHPRLRADFPALRSLESTPNNLPHSVSSFVGRDREMAQLSTMLDEHRLVTLLGVGGVGKSRLALQVAAERLPRHDDGVWLVELAPLADPGRIEQAIAQAMGVREEPGRPIDEALARHVNARELLLLIDNCEHLLEPCATVVRRLLAAGAGVRILATSREPLRIAGEATHLLPGLGVPGPLHALSAEAVQRHEAARLFVDRARAALASFEMDDENAAHVAAICHRLDGLPLAIELAAARIRSMPVGQIAERLKHRFRLLTGGDPSASPRQRTLRALIDWSHELLPEEERTLFRRLAVFSGGWTLEAAEQACAFGPIPTDAVVDLLGRLVEKSLVVLEPETARFRMLETVREYGREALAASPDGDEAARRHLEYFALLAQQARQELAGPRQGEWMSRLDAERENLVGSLDTAHRSPELALPGLRLANALVRYWLERGLPALGERVTARALEHVTQEDALRAQGLFNLGQLRYFMGRDGEARRALEESLRIARSLGDQYVAAVLQPLGMACIGDEDFAQARRCFEESLALAEARADKRAIAGALHALAMLHRAEGRAPDARPLYERSVALCAETENVEGQAIGLLNIAMVALDGGDLDEGRSLARRGLALGASVDSMRARVSALEVCAGLAALQGEWHEAVAFCAASDEQAIRSGLRRDRADESFLAPKLARARAALGDAAYDDMFLEARRRGFAAAMEAAQAWLEPAATRASPPAGAEVTASR